MGYDHFKGIKAFWLELVRPTKLHSYMKYKTYFQLPMN